MPIKKRTILLLGDGANWLGCSTNASVKILKMQVCRQVQPHLPIYNYHNAVCRKVVGYLCEEPAGLCRVIFAGLNEFNHSCNPLPLSSPGFVQPALGERYSTVCDIAWK